MDAEGRVTSRCYASYADGSPQRCYGAAYDAVGNPTTLSDPEGTSTLVYDALDRLVSVTRGGVVETYTYNALGALSANATSATGVTLADERPRLDGNGTAPSGIAATVDGLGVNVDGIGRVTSLEGDTFTNMTRGPVKTVTHADGSTESFGYGPSLLVSSRVFSNAAPEQNEYYVYAGANISAQLDDGGNVMRSYFDEGVDAPLRTTANGAVTYYELDTTGNVRRLRASGGADLGGYRYSAFGVMYPADGGTPAVAAGNDQPLKWKARPFLSTVGGGVYDMRARWWSPRLGAFVQADAFGYIDARSTLWGWPGQNPYRWSDSTGHFADDPAPWVAATSAFLTYGTQAAIDAASAAAVGTAVATGGAVALIAAPIVVAGALIAQDLDAFNNPVISYSPNGGSCQASGGGSMGGGGGGGGPPGTPPAPPGAGDDDDEGNGDKTPINWRDLLSGLQRGDNTGVYLVNSEAELQSLFDALSQGGTSVQSSYKGPIVQLPDGTNVGMRSFSATGGSTIDIFPQGGGRPIKVHIGP